MSNQNTPPKPEDDQTTPRKGLDGAACSPRVFVADDDQPTPETDAAEWIDHMCTPSHTVESSFARKLERQRNGAFALIDYAGEILGVPKQEHKSAHGFKILMRIKELVGQEERAHDALSKLAKAEYSWQRETLASMMLDQDLLAVRDIIEKGGTAQDVLMFLDIPNAKP